jgi:molybdopterin molybdotransferase
MKTLDQIAAELAGYDPQALSADSVSDFLRRMIEPVRETETVGIFQALGRILAADVISPVDVPPHDNSAMDGFAFDGAQLADTLASTLKIVGTAYAGKAWRGDVQQGECVKIMTGAVMPHGLDTVAPQELVTVEAQQVTLPANRLRLGDNRRARGEDIRLGQAALQKGQTLTPAALGLVASLGLQEVLVWRQLTVAYFSTGDEILSLGEAPREGAVYDSNRYTVFGLLTRLGVKMIDMGVVRDEPVVLEKAFKQAASRADVVITSGGVSVGEADHTRAMMQQLAGSAGGVAFWRIAMRPGRPMAVGRIAKPGAGGVTVLFGLPGNPVAVMVTFLAFVRPALLQMMGCTTLPPPYLKAVSSEAIRKKPGRTEYQRGIVTTAPDGSLHVQSTGNQGSGVLSSMTQANGLIVLHHGQANVAAGELVDVMMFDGVI